MMRRKNNPRKCHSVGSLGERRAALYLRLRGYSIKARNYRAGHHEIDIVASRMNEIVFVEVKARSYREEELETAPPPRMAVNADKIRFTRAAAKQYLFEHPTNKKPRMDVIELWFESGSFPKKPRLLRIHHIKGAY